MLIEVLHLINAFLIYHSWVNPLLACYFRNALIIVLSGCISLSNSQPIPFPPSAGLSETSSSMVLFKLDFWSTPILKPTNPESTTQKQGKLKVLMPLSWLAGTRKWRREDGMSIGLDWIAGGKSGGRGDWWGSGWESAWLNIIVWEGRRIWRGAPCDENFYMFL